MSSLKQQSVAGVFWNLAERFGVYVFKFFIGIILARLLTPADFGLVGMIYVFIAVAEVFVSSGLGLAYVQKKEVTDADANTIFYTNLVLSAALYIIIFLGAPLIAGFYSQPKLIEISQVMGFIIVINAFSVIQNARIVRSLDFNRRAKVTLIGTLIGGTGGVVAAYWGMGVWALVIQSMINRTMIAIGFWITSQWKPRWQFSIESFRELFAFGSWSLGSNVVMKVFDNIYVIAIGRFFPAAQVGFFNKAKGFQQLASEHLVGAISSVGFPVYAKLQDDKEKLRNGMRKFMQYTLVFIIPLLIGLIVVANPFVILLIKEKWAPMIPYMQLLCVAGMFFPLTVINIQALTAQGKIRLSFRLTLLQTGLRIVNIACMYPFGIIYMIWGEVVLSFVYFIITTRFIKQSVNYGIIKQINDIWKIITGGIIAGIIAYLPNFMTNNLPVLLFTGIFLTFSIFIGTQYLFNRKLFFNTIALKDYLINK